MAKSKLNDSLDYLTYDDELICIDCGRAFTFTIGEKFYYFTKGLHMPPKRCLDCRLKRKLTINSSRIDLHG